jgi:hypothetical protein
VAPDAKSAIAREKQLKLPAASCRESSILRVVLFILIARSWIQRRVSREKEAFINAMNPVWKDLYDTL